MTETKKNRSFCIKPSSWKVESKANFVLRPSHTEGPRQ
jgi:hypothetical protein